MLILKFFLHVSQREQEQRFLERLEDPTKNWKFSLADLKERDRWPQYQAAFEDMLGATSSRYAPWYVVPADQKWFTRLAVVNVIVEAMEKLDLKFPTVSKEMRSELAEARKLLKPAGKA